MLRTLVGLLFLALLALPAVGQDDKKKPAVDVDKDAVKPAAEVQKKADADKDEPKKDAPKPAATDPKKKPDADKDPPKPADSKKKSAVDVDKDDAKSVSEAKQKLVSAGKYVGKLTQVEGAQKHLTLQVRMPVQKTNPQALQTMASLQAQLADASRRRDVGRMADLQRQLAQQQPVKLESVPVDIKLQADDDVKVRTGYLPPEYDERGKPRKYTAKEISDLKGSDTKVPGYKAEFDNLRTGQEVEVHVLRPKTTPGAKKAKAKDAAAEEVRHTATLIVILRDVPAK